MTDLVISHSEATTSNRDRVLDAAERLLGRFGYGKMTVDDIAAEAGIGKGTVYLSFPSKQEVVLSTVDRIVDRVCFTMEKEAARSVPAGAALSAMLRARIFIRFEAVADYSASLNDLVGSIRASLLARRVMHFEQEIGVLAGLIRRGQENEEIRAGSPLRIARALVMATNSFLPYALSPQELGDASRLRREAGDVIDMLIDGITAVKTTTTTPRSRGA